MNTIYILLLVALHSTARGSLINDLKDFEKVIPVDKIKTIAHEHLENDAEFGELLKYLQGLQWEELENSVKSRPDWQEFEKYLNKAGLDVDNIIKSVHDSIANLHPGAHPGKSQNLRDFLDEIEKVIPLDKLMELFNEKLEKSEDFKNFFKRVSSPQTKQLVEEVRALPEVQRIIKRLNEFGIEVQKPIEIIYDLLGWGTPVN